jgi:hypothetical protein
MNKDKNIIFTLDPRFEFEISKLYFPTPALKEIPDWYKNMASSLDTSLIHKTSESKTIKRCMPVFDAMTAGYLLKTWTDIEFYTDDNKNLNWNWSLGLPDNLRPIENHPGFQLMNYKNETNINGALKFINPFGISTPKGYSTLFINPPHHPDWGGNILEGIVDTDTYGATVNFPFILRDIPKMIPAGTPIAMVIPFKRETWQMKMGNEETTKKMQNDTITVLTKYLHGYKNLYRQKKEYK